MEEGRDGGREEALQGGGGCSSTMAVRRATTPAGARVCAGRGATEGWGHMCVCACAAQGPSREAGSRPARMDAEGSSAGGSPEGGTALPGVDSGHGSAGAPSIPLPSSPPPPAPFLPSLSPCQPVGVPLPPPRAHSLSRFYRNDISGTGLKKKRRAAGEPLPSKGDPAARGRAHSGGQPPQRRCEAVRCLSPPAYCLRDTAPTFGNTGRG